MHIHKLITHKYPAARPLFPSNIFSILQVSWLAPASCTSANDQHMFGISSSALTFHHWHTKGEKNLNQCEYIATDSRNSFNIMSRNLQHTRGHYESTFQFLAFQSALGVNRRADQLSQLFPSHFKCWVEFCHQAKDAVCSIVQFQREMGKLDGMRWEEGAEQCINYHPPKVMVME